jgi:hypothetical protein
MNDRQYIEGIALDYYEGWFEVDAARMFWMPTER